MSREGTTGHQFWIEVKMKDDIQAIREAGIKGLCKKAAWYNTLWDGTKKFVQNVGTMGASFLNGAGQMALALPGFVGGLATGVANGTYQGIKDGSWSSALSGMLNGMSDGQDFVDSHIGVLGTDMDLKHWRDWLERGQAERELEFRERNDMSPDHGVFKKPREGMQVQDVLDSFSLGGLHGSHLWGSFALPGVGFSKLMRPIQAAKNVMGKVRKAEQVYNAAGTPAKGAKALAGAGARKAWHAMQPANPIKHPWATGFKGYMGYNYLQQAKDVNQQLNERNRYELPMYSSPNNTPYATPQPVASPRYVSPKRRTNYTY